MDTKEKILQTSFSIFLNKGFENTTMNDLIKSSGLSKGAFYHYFANKKALYIAVIDSFFLLDFKKIEWSQFDYLKFEEIEQGIKLFYIEFVSKINELSEKGLSNYFVMFFQAYTLHPSFLIEIQKFYLKLEKKVNAALKKENIVDRNAKNVIAKYEGILFWLSIFPQEKIEQLIYEI